MLIIMSFSAACDIGIYFRVCKSLDTIARPTRNLSKVCSNSIASVDVIYGASHARVQSFLSRTDYFLSPRKNAFFIFSRRLSITKFAVESEIEEYRTSMLHNMV